MALLVFLVGVAMTNRPARKKAAYVLLVALVATLVPLASEGIAAIEVGNMVFWAALWLVAYYLLVRTARCLAAVGVAGHPGVAGRFGPSAPGRGPPADAAPAAGAAWPDGNAWRGATATLLLAALLSFGMGAKPQAAVAEEQTPPAPVSVPDDAIIVPYDPDWKVPTADADKLLVPYEKFVELWNLRPPGQEDRDEGPARRLWARRGGVQDDARGRGRPVAGRANGNRRFR